MGFARALPILRADYGPEELRIHLLVVSSRRNERVLRISSEGGIERFAPRMRCAAPPHSRSRAMIDPRDTAALAVFLAFDAAKSISGQMLAIDNDRQRA
jgi:hypothetical protein